MKRTRAIIEQPDAILVSDIHLHERHKKLECRRDDLWEAQWIKMGFIKDLQVEYGGCPVINAGDLYEHWKPSPYLLLNTMQFIPKNFWSIYGQHDLPQHNIDLAYKCGINVLKESGHLQLLNECHYGQSPDKGSLFFPGSGRGVLVWHKLTYKDEKPFPQHKGPTALRILKKYPMYDLIVTGDNHKPFVQEYKGRILVNPGSLLRLTAGQVDHRPRVYLWYAKTNTVKPIYIPIEKGVVSREHIEKEQERNKRIGAFVSRLDDDFETTVSFEENLRRFHKTNNVDEAVMNIIYKAIDDDTEND